MIAAAIVPKTRDLGDGFQVRRALPAIEKRAVGPFVFFDQMGPVRLAPGKGLDVRPHPHIGLATITYLFCGEILHRDSLGTVQPIRPGEVNWMTAGRGIVHSERTPAALRAAGPEVFGIQVWVGMPAEHEEAQPSFVHAKAKDLAVLDGGMRLIVGTLGGARSPVPTHSPIYYVDAPLAAGASAALPLEHAENAAYVAEGEVEAGGQRFPAGQLLVFESGKNPGVRAVKPSRVLFLGGEPLDHRHMWWNFVSSRKERIAQAAADWKAGRFAPVPGETEFIPLPDGAPGVVSYP